MSLCISAFMSVGQVPGNMLSGSKGMRMFHFNRRSQITFKKVRNSWTCAHFLTHFPAVGVRNLQTLGQAERGNTVCRGCSNCIFRTTFRPSNSSQVYWPFVVASFNSLPITFAYLSIGAPVYYRYLLPPVFCK